MKPRESFHLYPKGDGLRAWCRGCVGEYSREYRAKNRDRLLRYDHERYPARRDGHLLAMRADYRKNRDQYLARAAKRRADNPEASRANNLAYKKANPEKWREYQRRWRDDNPHVKQAEKQRRRTRERCAPGRGVSAREWRAIVAGSLGICVYCHSRAKRTMDHVIPILGGGAHDPDNVVAACLSCNSSKGATPLIVWMAKRDAMRELIDASARAVA